MKKEKKLKRNGQILRSYNRINKEKEKKRERRHHSKELKMDRRSIDNSHKTIKMTDRFKKETLSFSLKQKKNALKPNIHIK